MSENQYQYSESFVRIANDFNKECEKIRQLPLEHVGSLDGVLATLPHIEKTKGYVFEVLTPCFNHLDFLNLCYAREEDSPNEKEYYWAKEYMDDTLNPPVDILKLLGFQGKPEDPEEVKKAQTEHANSILSRRKPISFIEDRIRSVFCPESAWEWLLLRNLWEVLARDEDSQFHLCKYVFHWKDCLDLATQLRSYFTDSGNVVADYEERIRKEHLPLFKKPYENLPDSQYMGIPTQKSFRSAIEFLKEKPSLLPYVEYADEKTIDIVYYAWCSWGGLAKYTCRASSRKKGRINIQFLKKESVFDYYFKIGCCPFKCGDKFTGVNQVLFQLRPYKVGIR